MYGVRTFKKVDYSSKTITFICIKKNISTFNCVSFEHSLSDYTLIACPTTPSTLLETIQGAFFPAVALRISHAKLPRKDKKAKRAPSFDAKFGFHISSPSIPFQNARESWQPFSTLRRYTSGCTYIYPRIS